MFYMDEIFRLIEEISFFIKCIKTFDFLDWKFSTENSDNI